MPPKRDRLAREQVRHRILAAVQAEPGIRPRQLDRLLGVPWTTLRHHLRALCADGLVVAAREGDHMLLHAPGQAPAAARIGAALRDPLARQTLQALLRDPGLGLAGLHRKTAVARHLLRGRLRRLEQAGLVRRSSTYHPAYYAVQPLPPEAEEAMRRGPPDTAHPSWSDPAPPTSRRM